MSQLHISVPCHKFVTCHSHAPLSLPSPPATANSAAAVTRGNNLRLPLATDLLRMQKKCASERLCCGRVMQAFQRVKVLASPVLRATSRSMGHDVVPKGFNVPRAKYIVGMVSTLHFFLFLTGHPLLILSRF